jgi:superfamily II DNA helicase RecQ
MPDLGVCGEAAALGAAPMAFTWAEALGEPLAPEEQLRRCLAASPHAEHSADQLASLELVCSGRDGLVLLRTGGGKTLLWQLPAKALGDGLTVVVVPSKALALDLKESTDRLLQGTGLLCIIDERRDDGDAIAPPPAPEMAAAAVIGMAWAARRLPWRCETECAGCVPLAGKPRNRCFYRCGTCPGCKAPKKSKCDTRAAREAAWAAQSEGGGSGADRTGAGGTPPTGVGGTPRTSTAGGRTRSRLGAADADDNKGRPTEDEVRARKGTAAYAALCEPKVRVIITTPEGLAGPWRESQRLRLALERCGCVRRIVVDEAQCALPSSHGSFRPEYLKLGGCLRHLAQLQADVRRPMQILGLSASVPPPLRPELKERLGMDAASAAEHVGELDRPEITFATCLLPMRRRQSFNSIVLEAWAAAKSATPEGLLAGRILIYTTTAVQARVAADVLSDAGVPAGAYCSRGMTAAERARSLAEWDAGAFRVMVATKAFGQGIDRPDVSAVYHFGLPQDIDEWWQENGRAARGPGTRGFALTFLHKRFVVDRVRLAARDDSGTALHGVARLLRLLTSECCLRDAALEYLGGQRAPRTGEPAECCCRCQRRTNGEFILEPVIDLQVRCGLT